MGDGATSQPDFHNAMNFAGVFRVPCVMICQNNHWSISVPTSRQTASQTIAVKAKAYGVPGLRVDGNDILAVYRAVSDAAQHAREGGGPTFIECVTYRMGAHSTSDDPTRYRSEEEVQEWAKKDPVDRFRRHLAYLGVLDDALEAQDRPGARRGDSRRPSTRSSSTARPSARRCSTTSTPRLPWNLEEERAELLSSRPRRVALSGSL